MTAPSNAPAPWATTPPTCHCGQALTRCATCGDLRCLRCDPYRSDDCGSAGADPTS